MMNLENVQMTETLEIRVNIINACQSCINNINIEIEV